MPSQLPLSRPIFVPDRRIGIGYLIAISLLYDPMPCIHLLDLDGLVVFSKYALEILHLAVCKEAFISIYLKKKKKKGTKKVGEEEDKSAVCHFIY